MFSFLSDSMLIDEISTDAWILFSKYVLHNIYPKLVLHVYQAAYEIFFCKFQEFEHDVSCLTFDLVLAYSWFTLLC